MLNYFQKKLFFYYWSGTISPKMNSQSFSFRIKNIPKFTNFRIKIEIFRQNHENELKFESRDVAVNLKGPEIHPKYDFGDFEISLQNLNFGKITTRPNSVKIFVIFIKKLSITGES